MRKLILSAIFVMLLILSVVFVYPITGNYEELETKTPGVDIWEGGGYLINATDTNDVLETDTADLYYNQTLNIEVNDSLDWGAGPYWVWYPMYTGSIGNTYTLTWHKWNPTSGPSPTIGGTDFIFEDIHLNRSGLWIIDSNDNHSASSLSIMNSTIPAWFWVNASEELNIKVDDTVYYNEDTSITVNVTREGEGHACLIDVRDDTITIFPQGNIWADNPIGEITFLSDNLTHAGEYTVYAYHDLDSTEIYYQENPKYYDSNYGNGTITADNYNYTLCGAWDPPEYMGETKTITVETAEPIITLTNADNIYWGFHAMIDVNITDDDGQGLDSGIIKIKNRHDTYLPTMLPALNITNIGNGDYTVEFARGALNWSMLDTGNVNGTWYVCYSEDNNTDGWEEWNNSKSFVVGALAPGAFIDITDDGYDNPTDLKVNVLDYAHPAPTIEINFTIYGESIEGESAYYGDDISEDGDNITIVGDILFNPSEDDNTLINHNNGQWTAVVTPTNPGYIDISIDWKDNTDSKHIKIENGTYVTTNIDSFVVDENATLWVTVKNMNNNNEEYSDVHLFWEDDGAIINHTKGDGKDENGKDGKYKFIIDKTQHRDVAPEKIVVCADTPGLGYWGYTIITMIPNNDLKVNCTPITSYAGDEVEYSITVRTLDGDKPSTYHLVVELYNENDDVVWYNNNDYDIEDTIILAGGTYRFYAYNDTHDSRGNNATITVQPYNVSCSPSVLAWLIDKDTNLTFTVTPKGNGDLKVYNVSGGDVATNGNVVVEIINGTGQLKGIDATDLGNVTYEYKPYDGQYRRANGMLKVTTATATPNPITVYANEATSVTVTITHPSTGNPIPDVKVGLVGGVLLSVPGDEVTDSNGEVEFGITTGGSGEIIILIEDEFDPDNAFVIKSSTRYPMKVTAPSTVNENSKFTVTIKSGENLVTDEVTVKFAGNDYTTSSGTIELTAPSVTLDLDYDIEVSAEGYTDDETKIRVSNMRQLIILLDDDSVNGNDKVSIVVTDDTGSVIAGATVTFNGKEYKTDNSGKVTLTAPNENKNYTISVSFEGFQSCDKPLKVTALPETPGFVLLTLIASIGVAFILMKRKQN